MPRQWSVRVLRAFVALWFVLSVGEPSIVHFCPMHGGLLGELAGASATAGMPGMPMSGSGESGGASRTEDTGRQGAHHTGTPQSPHHCTCIDCCVGAGATALPSEHVALQSPAVVVAVAATVPSVDALPRPAPAHAQPPGTGPPRA